MEVMVDRKRAAAYCRVSTGMECQEGSYETQIKYYKDLISNDPDEELVKIYADEGSGRSTQRRPEFQQMMQDCEDGKIDVIYTKSISRFSRNMLDCVTAVRRLKELGIAVIFERENINTMDRQNELFFHIMAIIAEEESKSIGGNVKLAIDHCHEQGKPTGRVTYESRFARGEYNLGNNRILGYDSEDGVLVPNKDAWIVKEVFRRFLSGESYRQIAKGLKEMGAECLHSKRGFGVDTLRYMISNETYVGDKRLQKKAPVDYLTKKPDPNRKAMSNYLYDDHEAIIDRETWDKAQAILKERKELAKTGVYKTNREHHFLYGKVFCGECGAPFLRRTFNGSTPYKAWNCRNRQKGKGKAKCGNRFIREEQLLDQIQEELGWPDMDQERFQKEVSRVLVFTDHIEIIKE